MHYTAAVYTETLTGNKLAFRTGKKNCHIRDFFWLTMGSVCLGGIASNR